RDASIDMNEIKGVGHRVVMGGSKFASSVEITDEVMREIQNWRDLMPLHIPASLMGIESARQILPNATQVAVFDTAFLQTMPEYAYRYAVPDAWYRELGVRRYGFHGTSHLYVSKRAAALLGKPADKCNLITMHIGSGASGVAIKNGRAVDTTLGMTPTAGLMMGTRPGDVDAGALLYVMEKLNLTPEQMTKHLNKDSGHLGITKCFADRRDVETNRDSNADCKLALEMEVHSVKKYIGAFLAELGHVDALVFTAGVGENDSYLRGKFCEGLEELGIKIDMDKNDKALARLDAGECEISTPDSRVKVFMIPTNEEIVIVEDTLGIMNKTYDADHLKMKYSFAE
ncbi:MAG: acetate/propionate family kinase, partial [Alphaproteobacteria bacterium]|nr:acetate/propionate family kinase [Alphaproteobacteria bacterium]